jgi:tRNA(Ile)-lysidine synthase
MDAWEKFKGFIKNNKLVEPGDRVLLAVSGGPDSVCLAHLFWRLKKSLPLELLIVNMDHGLRRESSRESGKVEKLGKKLGIPALLRKIKVREAADADGISLETAGRNLRYKTLFSIAKEKGFNKIATGHTANDNAETVLMWLMRGTGTEGLSGIPVVRTGEAGIQVLRPMLPVTREEIISYLKRQKIGFSIDRSNLKLDFTRNRIRHEVLPVLKRFNPKLVEHIFNLSRIVAGENEFLHGITRRILKKIVRISKNSISLDLKLFFGYNEAVKLRILKEILPEKQSIQNIRRLTGLVLSENREEILLSKRWRVEKKNNKLFFRKTDNAGGP